jgi:hypothetical protein
MKASLWSLYESTSFVAMSAMVVLMPMHVDRKFLTNLATAVMAAGIPSIDIITETGGNQVSVRQGS